MRSTYPLLGLAIVLAAAFLIYGAIIEPGRLGEPIAEAAIQELKEIRKGSMWVSRSPRGATTSRSL